MTGEPTTTIVGNLTGDPDLHFTSSGKAVVNFTIAQTPRNFNKKTSAWDEGETLFMRCTAFDQAAENIAESLSKGQRVMAMGRLVSRSFTLKTGEQRTQVELLVDDAGPSLRFKTTAKADRTQPAGEDPWATA